MRVVLLSLVFAVSAIQGQFGSRHLYKDSYRDHYVLGKYLSDLSGSEDLVVTVGLEPVVLYYSRRNGWTFPPIETLSSDPLRHKGTWDHGLNDVSMLDELKLRGAKWLVIASWNGYTGGSGQDFLRQEYPILYAAIVQRFDVVREIPEGMIFRARNH